MMTLSDMLRQASEVLGVDPDGSAREIQYAFYRLMTLHHPDRNPGDRDSERRSALIIEARDVLMGKVTRPVLLRDRRLMADVLKRPVADAEVLSYEEWLKEQFFDVDQGSIWPG